MSQADTGDRRSRWNVFRVEADITRRQVSQILLCAGIYIVGTTLAMCVHYFWIQHALQGTAPTSGSLLDEFAWHWRFADGFRRALISWLVGVGALSAVFAVGLGSHFARTVAGPVHALKRELARIAASGEPAVVKLREGDQLSELAESITAAIAAVGRDSGARDADEPQDRLEAVRRDLSRHLERLDTGGLPQPEAARLEAWTREARALLEKA